MNHLESGKGKWAHLVAIGGTGMGALAALLQDLGFYVTGSDGPLYPPMSTFLEARKIPLATGYAAENIQAQKWGINQFNNPDLIIVGNAISKTNAEAQAVELLISKNPQITRMSFAQALAHFCIGPRDSFVIAGTHGKTTTTSLMAWALESSGHRPGFFIGGIPKNFSKGSQVTDSDCFAVEGDEYDTAYWDKESKFLHYRPTWVLCTGIEFDHADIYTNVTAIEDSFIKLVKLTKKGWVLVDQQSAPRKESVERIEFEIKKKNIACIRYGEAESSDYRLLSYEPAPLPWKKDSVVIGSKLKLKTKSAGIVECFSPMIGRHNALNTLGVVATLLESGRIKNTIQIQEFLKTFQGIKRRQDEIYTSPQLIVIDDFAHHPTAIHETVSAIRHRYPDRKLIAFFEPRSATSARNIMQNEFSACFDEADCVALIAPTKTNIPEADRLNVEQVIDNISKRPGNANKLLKSFKTVDDLWLWLKEYLHQNQEPTLALLMSNGSFGDLYGKITREFAKS